MITLTSLEYELKETPVEVLSRLNWSVEEIETSWWQDLNNLNVPHATQKDWIGQIDQRNLAFSIQEPGSIIKRKLNVVVKGRFSQKAASTNVHVRLGLDNFTFILIVMIYLATALNISEVFTNEEFNDYFSLGFFLISLPILGTFLIWHRMKSAESKLDILFA
jgi:hypothetical protein